VVVGLLVTLGVVGLIALGVVAFIQRGQGTLDL